MRLGIACDEPTNCSGIQAVLRDQEEIRVVWLPVAEDDLLESFNLLQLDVLLLDMACGFPPDIDHRLRKHGYSAPIILWKREDKVGFRGEEDAQSVVLDKRSSPSMLLACVESVLAGRKWNFTQPAANAMLAVATPSAVQVSPREAELIHLVAEGLSNRQIAERLHLTEGSVKVYFSRLFQKLGVPDRVGLLLYSMQQPWNGGPARRPALRLAKRGHS